MMIINNNRGLNTNSVRQDEKVNDKRFRSLAAMEMHSPDALLQAAR